MKVTLVPEQKLLSASLEAITTIGVTLLMTAVVTLFPLAVALVAQAALEVNSTVTTSLFAKAVDV